MEGKRQKATRGPASQYSVLGPGEHSLDLSQPSDAPHKETVVVPEMLRSYLELAQLTAGARALQTRICSA